jgi:hypothetical protein
MYIQTNIVWGRKPIRRVSDKRNYCDLPDFNLRTYYAQSMVPEVASMRSEKIISQTIQKHKRALTNLEIENHLIGEK